MSQSPWLRRLIVTLGPLEEYKGASGGSIVRFEGNGRADSIRIIANIQKTLMGLAPPSNISVYNLAEKTRDGIQRAATKITVEAGWENTGVQTVFSGTVMSTHSERTGPDIVTKISAIPGYGALSIADSSKSFKEGTQVRLVVKELVRDLPNIRLSENDLKEINGAIRKGGWSYIGATKDALLKLAEEYGFSWNIEDGGFRALGDRATFGKSVGVTDASRGNLISVTPNVTGPMQIMMGIRAKAVFAFGILPGNEVRVTSVLNKKLSGNYKLHKVSYNLDSHSDAWTADMEAFINRGQYG